MEASFFVATELAPLMRGCKDYMRLSKPCLRAFFLVKVCRGLGQRPSLSGAAPQPTPCIPPPNL